MTGTSVGPLEAALRARRDSGAKLLVPYVTGGLDDQWVSVVKAIAGAGADAIEIGIPFSDPVMDGPIIQEASARALARGATPVGILSAISQVEIGVPLTVMTYYNLVFRAGLEDFARSLAGSGIAGAIVPDLPLEELDEWGDAAGAAGVETILLAAPTTDDDRLAQICRRSRGWVYGVGLMGVTGERTGLAASATLMGKRLKAVTDKPVLIGVGVSTPEQAAEACAHADGVIVGSALVRRLVEGQGPAGAARFVAELRAGLDAR
ncbi:MAG: tryptophan synthase subunit alpha [Actinomycetota bacterium]|nr:tryptophan synthase subunit alpha [Actinomycetota bacterium]